MEVSLSEKLFFEGPVESFQMRVVFWCFWTGPIPREAQLRGSRMKVFHELGAVIGVDIGNVPVQQIPQPLQEVCRRCRGMAGIHPGIGQPGVMIDGGEDIPF